MQPTLATILRRLRPEPSPAITSTITDPLAALLNIDDPGVPEVLFDSADLAFRNQCAQDRDELVARHDRLTEEVSRQLAARRALRAGHHATLTELCQVDYNGRLLKFPVRVAKANEERTRVAVETHSMSLDTAQAQLKAFRATAPRLLEDAKDRRRELRLQNLIDLFEACRARAGTDAGLACWFAAIENHPPPSVTDIKLPFST